MSTPTITGIHHITAIASHPQRNLDFYTGVLGLRLVKLTINFDDPGTYHFYFGNAAGSPGSILTFFPWPDARRGLVGNGQVTATSFGVPAASLLYWRTRLVEQGIAVEDVGERFGEAVIRCADPDGMPIELVATTASPAERAWTQGDVAAEHAIAGFHSATLSEEGYEQTAALLQDVMGFTLLGAEGNRFRYRAAGGESAAIVDVVCAPDGRQGRSGAGTVHHIAWRTPDDHEQRLWLADLMGRGYNTSPIMDRTYFHSIYFREPGGILFEIATDPPGFAIDEAPDRLGARLMLPPWLEPRREMVEGALPPLTMPGQRGRSSR